MEAKNLVVIGHGMVGHRFVEALRSRDTQGCWRVTVLAEETDAAYDRVGLTYYTEHWDRAQMALVGNNYDGDQLVELRLGDPATAVAWLANALAPYDIEIAADNGPNSVTVAGSVPAIVTIAARNSGSASSAPRSTSICCMAICPRAPTARDSASASVRTRSSPPVTSPAIAVSAVTNSGA